MTTLAQYDRARAALAEIKTLPEAVTYAHSVEHLRLHARQVQDRTLMAEAAEIQFRAEVKLGELLARAKADGHLREGRPKKNHTDSESFSLKDLKLTPRQSSEAQRKASISERAQLAMIDRMRERILSGGATVIDMVAKTETKKQQRETRERALAEKQTSLPTKRYGLILADPEWRFAPYSRATGMDRSADNHYPTSATDEIAARDVPSIAAPDCVLFLWATAPMLPDALRVMAAWGFTYRSHIIWRKDKIGTGYWFRNMHELLLVGTRGNIPAPAPGTQARSMFDAPVAEHSRKPDATYELIEAYFPHLPKIELNARTRRPGWDAWGNEAPAEESNHCTDSIHRTDSVPPHPQPQPEKDAGKNQCAGTPQPREDESSHDMSPGAADDQLDIPAFLDRRKWAGAPA